MAEYRKERAQHRNWPRLRWQPVPLSTVPKYFIRAVILAEDSRFYEHSGFDLIAFKEAMEYNLREGRFVLGASTISQQTVKNLFLSPARNPLRKWHELILTWGMEHNLSKHRILELYLNIAQFGRGIYGVQAATQAYWGIDPDRMSLAQAAELIQGERQGTSIVYHLNVSVLEEALLGLMNTFGINKGNEDAQ